MADRIPYFKPQGRGKIRTRNPYEERAGRKADKRFYASAAWIRLRDYKLQCDPLCQERDCREVASHVHHVKPRKQFPELALDLDNLKSLCQSCHNKQEVR